jgi:two-component system cell cycle sensor histidine kinase/response regulator CckA
MKMLSRYRVVGFAVMLGLALALGAWHYHVQILQTWHEKAFLVVLLALAVMVTAMFAAAMLWQRSANAQLQILVQSQEALRGSQERHLTTLMSIGDAVIVTDDKGLVELLNPVAERLTGWLQQEAWGKPIGEVFRIVNEQTRAAMDNPVERVLHEGGIVGLANHTILIGKDGTEHCIADSGSPIRSELGHMCGVVLVFRDITDARQMEEQREATIQILRLLNTGSDFHELLQSATSFLRSWTGCEAVGIRLWEGDDYPYFQTQGFPEEFIKAENYLCVSDSEGQSRRDESGNAVLECMCGNVLQGRFDPTMPFFTANGSFWTNSTTGLLGSINDLDHRGRIRNRCNSEGYESVALIPLRSAGRTQGLLQFNDRRKGRFSPQYIAVLEHLADSLAIALVQRRASDALRESEAKYERLYNSMAEAVVKVDLAGHFLESNRAYQEMVGYSAEELASLTYKELTPEKWHAMEDGLIKTQVLNRGYSAVYEKEYRRKDGIVFPIELRTYLLRDPAGVPAGMWAIVRDITDRKHAEQAIRQSEARYRSLFENMLNGLAYCRIIIEPGQVPDFEYLAVNKAFETLTGLKNVVGQTISQVVPGIQQTDPELLETYARVARTGVPETFETYVHALEMWFSITAYSLGDGNFVAVFDVITERKKAEEALREASQLNQQIIASAQEGVVVYGLDLRYKVWNPFMETMTGLPAKDVLGKHPLEVFPFLGDAGVIASFERALAGQTPEPIEFQFTIPGTGRAGWASDMAGPLRSADGKIIGVMAIIRDITEMKKAMAALAEETTRRRVLFEQSPDGIVIIDTETAQFIEFNAAAHEQLGYTRQEFAKMGISDVDAVETLEEIKARIARVLHEGRVDFETRQRTKQGAIRNVLVTAQSLNIVGRPVYHCVWRDITARKELEMKLLHAQKMDAIGRLAGGIAHDFRNQLAVIKGYGEMLQRRALVSGKGMEMVDQIIKASDRSALLTGQLLAFSRKQTLDVRRVDLTELIADISKAILRMVGEDVQLLAIPCSKPCVVDIDPAQFQQAILNLVANARDAMPNGGRLTITTSCGELPAGVRRRHGEVKPGQYVGVSVRDAGCGMDAATVARLFEPFFTTKEVGKGTGLGLPMVYGFVQQSGGFTDVESLPGKGSTFTLYFPLSTAKADAAGQATCCETKPPGGTETILVVEDEDAVRNMLVDSLREAGYTVLKASRIAEALTIVDTPGTKIDMLITDVIMPEGSGIELAQRIEQENRAMKILFISGYPGSELTKRGIAMDSSKMMTKPCDYKVLLHTVRQSLDNPAGN